MNRNFWIVLVAGIGLAGLSSLYAKVESDYAVSAVLNVRSLSEFDCKIDGYSYAPSVRFRVQVRDVVTDPKLPADETAEYLRERLKKAERVVLKQVQFRNYFRVIADVTVDGRDLRQELIQQGFARSTEHSNDVADASQESPRDNPPRRYQPTVKYSAPATSQVEKRVVTLQSLLDTEVDFSMVNEETPFAEALQILSDSVRPRLPLVILWNDLETNALVNKDIPIGIGGIGKIKLKKALELVLHSVSGHAATKLLLSMQGQVITIGTQKGLLVKSTTHSYSVDDIISTPFSENTDNRRGN
ncbi:MAG: thermonuclease family protein [Phycisphaerae bacterium]|nr:thermonuclease family protein [Phycisphaerae bacterium]